MRKHLTVLAATTALLAATIPLPTAQAAVDGDDLVINEVYARGGSANQPFTHKFIELYNPTATAVDLSGWAVSYSSAANAGYTSTCQLSGSIAAGGLFVVSANSNGTNGEPLPEPTFACSNLSISGTTGAVSLRFNGADVDVVGWGTAVRHETTVAAYPGTNSVPGAITRTAGQDTDDNSADFTFVEMPTPGHDASLGIEGPDPEDPTDPPGGTVVTIAEIQGTGAASPMVGQSVTTEGVVTASYTTGGFNGFFMQTPGSGGETKTAEDASDGIFVWTRSAPTAAIGECYQVTGTVAEYAAGSDASGRSLTQLTDPTLVAQEECEAVTATELAELPATDAQREAYEGMLVLPQGTYTITNNYALNQYGTLGLAYGDQPLFQATDVVRPGPEAVAYEEANVAKEITLDDGASLNFVTNAAAKNSPLPYLSAETPMRTGSQVSFDEPVILDYRFSVWNYQPTAHVVGHEQSFLTTENDRPADAPEVGGDVQLASFNVLNYFDDLGVDEEGCGYYADREGNPVGTNRCQVRGAYSEAAFQDQEAKIVAAINKLDADVVGLQEIENSAGVTYKPGQPRDKALATLVEALNAAGGNWAFAPSPTVTPPNEDIIRTAFIYNPDTIELVGPSYILMDDAFADARQPLAQEFRVKGSTTTFVAIVNHFKSKGSGVDDGTGQGNANPSREAQASALSEWANTFEEFADKPVFLMGDFNAYTMETPLQRIEAAGFTNLTRGGVTEEATYQFSGRLGSLDHVFANAAALELVTDAAVWNINGDESIAFQYSRRNYNIVDFHANDEFASSDHDPVVVGIDAVWMAPVLAKIDDQVVELGRALEAITPSATGTEPIVITVEGLPAGVTYVDGVISGTPEAVTDDLVTITVTATSPHGTDSETFTIEVVDTTAPAVEDIANVTVVAGDKVEVQVKATDQSALSYAISGTDELSIDDDGLITGTPTTEGTTTITVTVTDAAGNKTTKTFTLTVEAAPVAPGVAEIADQTVELGEAMTPVTISVTGTEPIAITVEGLPAGVTYVDGVISGRPEAVTDDPVTITVTATSPHGTDSTTFTIEVVDTTAPVVEDIADVTLVAGDKVEVQVKATDQSALSYAISGTDELSIDDDGLITGTPTTEGTTTITVTVTDAAGNKTTKTFKLTVKAKAVPPVDPPVVDPPPVVEPPAPKYKRTAPYTLPGLHRGLNGRDWNTSCEVYSQTERCRTEIWATVVVIENGKFVRKDAWAFNNLTYLPYMTRAAWGDNPLANAGRWTATSDGRQWMTECDTDRTGSNGCRSYVYATVYQATPRSSGGYTFRQANKWVFNNIVMFGHPSLR